MGLRLGEGLRLQTGDIDAGRLRVHIRDTKGNKDRLVPLPAQLRTLAWQNQRLVYGLLFDCVWATIKIFSQNDKRLGGIPGVIAVLHTNSRKLNFHPHIHVVMPAATIDKSRRLWFPASQ